MKTNFFSAKKALADYAENKNIWTGGALIVATPATSTNPKGGFQAIPGAYLNDVSYTGSRKAIAMATVKAAAKKEAAFTAI